MKDVEIEVFRAGTKASRGITSKDIAALASAYDADKNPAAICIGHPKADTPAHGVIAGFRADGNRLFAKLKDVGTEVIEGIKSRKLINRSMAFFSPNHEANPTPGTLAPRHLGFLGASAPGIPGMSNLREALSFSADDELEVDGDPAPAIMFGALDEAEPGEPTIIFTVTDKEPVDMPPAKDDKTPTAEELATRASDLEKRETEFAAREATARKAGNDAIVDGLVASGKLLPADADKAKLIFNALESEPLEFEAGKDKVAPAAALASLLSGGVTLVDTSGERHSPSDEFKAGDEVASDPDKIEAAARGLMEADKSLTFEAAVEKVSTASKGA